MTLFVSRPHLSVCLCFLLHVFMLRELQLSSAGGIIKARELKQWKSSER